LIKKKFSEGECPFVPSKGKKGSHSPKNRRTDEVGEAGRVKAD